MELKSLHTIQKLAKVAKVLCRIVFVCGLIGCIGCVAGILALAAGLTESVQLGDVTIHGIIEAEASVSVGTMYASMAVACIFCIGEVILAKIAEKYFKNELDAGTPFTMEGAAQLKRLGIYTICIPLGTVIVASIAYEIISYCFTNVADLNIDNVGSIGLGIMFLVASVLCKYGAEVKQQNLGDTDDNITMV